MLRTIPTVSTERCFVGIITRTGTFVAIGAIPVARYTAFVCGMMRCIFGAIPEVLAGFGGCAALFALVTPPVMRTTFGLFVSANTLIAEPTVVWARIRRRMMRFFTEGARPEMRTAFRYAQNLFATFIRTVHVTVRAGVG